MKRSARDNKNLSEYVRRNLNVERFGEPFATMLVETFVRMQYVLDLSPEEIKEDISNFGTSTWRFRFDRLPGNTMGWSDPSKHEIVFSIDYWQNVMNNSREDVYTVKFFETFAHECLHGMQEVTDSRGQLYNRAGGYNQKTQNRSHAIYEICTQATAAKIARNRSYQEFDQGEVLTGDGYSDEIFAVSLIASTFGISEQEVLKYGLRERYKLIEVLDKHIGDRAYTETMLNQIEDELEMIHSIGYPDDNQKQFKNMSDEQKRRLKTESILKLTNLCQGVFAKRIESIPLDINNKTITAYKFDQKKMLDTLRYQFSTYGRGLDRDYNQMYFMATEFGDNASYIKNALNVLSDVAKDKSGRFSGSRTNIIDCIKRKDFDTLSRYGINVARDVTVYLASHDIEMREKKIHKDYGSLIDWDNTDLQDVIYRRTLRREEESAALYLKNWDESSLHDYNGNRKLYALEKAARATARAHEGKDIRYVLFKFLKADQREMESSVYSSITRTGGARDDFKREFSSLEDKEYLAKLMAEKYLDRIYDFERGTLKNNVGNKNVIEQEIRRNLLPTIQKYGKDHTMWAIAKTILEGNYDSISNGQIGARGNLSLISPESFLDVISEPLMNELMQKREISDGMRNAVTYAMYRTEEKYPGTAGRRMADFIEEYKQTGVFNHYHFTSNGREELKRTISSKEDLEAMIGVICNDFGDRADSEQYSRPGVNSAYYYLQAISVQMGTDSFREGIIHAIMENDYSAFPSDCARYLSTISTGDLFSTITYPTIDRAFQMGEVFEKYAAEQTYVPPVKVTDLKENAKKQKLSIIHKFLDKLKGIFGKSKKNFELEENNYDNDER